MRFFLAGDVENRYHYVMLCYDAKEGMNSECKRF
jgi:hypothetical protein